MFLFAEVEHFNLINLLLDFRTNFINWLILAGLIWWLCAKALPPVFKARHESIGSLFSEAEKAKALSEELLAQQKARVASGAQEAEQIVKEAKQVAEQMKTQLEAQTKADIEDLRKKFESSAHNEHQAAVSEMRSIAAKVAVKIAEETLTNSLSLGAKAKLLTQFVEQLDQVSGEESLTPPEGARSVH
jgi:F-type H+-transporting ATPase subunit b